MIQDFHTYKNYPHTTTDVCIIGAGAAGIALAREFIGTPWHVLLLESGGRIPETRTQALYESSVVGLPHGGIRDGRARVFGGTTTLWAGQALPFFPIDFQERPWIQDSGWPITRSELHPYYRRAEAVMNLEPRTYDEASWPTVLPSPPDFDDGTLRPFYSQFSATPDFAATYQTDLEQAHNVTVLLHANVVNVVTNPVGTQVEHLCVKTLNGKAGEVSARYFILCCGGIETARLLLASNSTHPHGIGNEHDLVGRYFQEHVHVNIPVYPRNRRSFETLFNTRRQRDVRYFPKLVSTPAFQGQHHILHVAADLCYVSEGETAVDAAKSIAGAISRRDFRGRLPQALRTLTAHPGQLVGALYRYAVLKRKLTEGLGAPHLCFQSESAPNRDSRITLSREHDALGMPKTVLDWQLTTIELRSIRIFAQAVDREIRRLGIGRLDLSVLPESNDPVNARDLIHDSYHHMGTTRMHDDPRRGVVDRHGRVHSANNLYIGSSSVFPTGGFSNPTLTILALCMRMADHLKQLMKEKPHETLKAAGN